MKRLILILTALLLAVLPALPCAALTTRTPTTTVMVYMSGADLETDLGLGARDIREMKLAGLDPEGPVTLLLATGGAKEWSLKDISADAHQYHRISSDGLETLKTYPAQNMGQAETLAHFLQFSLENYPTDRCMLVFWGHGDGPAGGVCFDQNHEDDGLQPDEIRLALAHVLEPGDKLDALVFDSCLMACADLVWSLDAYADWIVASQETAVGSGLAYHKWLAALAADPGMHTLEICRGIADSYMDSTSFGIFSTTSGISVLDTAHAAGLRIAAERLYRALDAALAADPDSILSIREGLLSCGTYSDSLPSDQLDVLTVAGAFSEIAPDECAQLRRAAEKCVVYNLNTRDLDGVLSGLSLFMPYETREWFHQAEDWYGPQAGHSDYARFILHMIEAVNEQHALSVTPIAEMWAGLSPAADAAQDNAAQTPISNLWAGLDMA